MLNAKTDCILTRFHGAHPDPSICRWVMIFIYLSISFSTFRTKIFKDLVNWELIGHGLHREDQMCNGENESCGCTIRWWYTCPYNPLPQR